ncbi:MAG: reverse transcriptase family protein, partial [Candidatus Andersenbacteria bacterium]|nr:reverse transcriptase family protein [Candidatus Andersenbacteria bacterium]
TSVVCRAMESIIRDNLMYHLVSNNLISDKQHGFVPRRACVTNLLETVDFTTNNLHKKTPTDIIFLDFSKAFDKVSHRRLLLKLEAYGIKGQILAWLSAFLSNRRQRVVLGDTASDWENVFSGVPQGSVLGPTLFIVYINDLAWNIENVCKLFADDCKLIASVNDEVDAIRLQKDLDSVSAWCNEWKMELNTEKCHVMHFGRNNIRHDYTISSGINRAESTLKKTTRERDLGIIITPDLKWQDQVCSSAAKASRMLGVLKNTFTTRDAMLWKKLYTTYIRPHLEFAVAAWNPYLKKDIETLERVQHRSTKVSGSLKNMSYEERCKRLGLSTLVERRMRGDMIQQFKIANGLDTVNWVKQPMVVEGRVGKRPQLRREVVNNCAQRHNFFSNRIVNEWNKLADETTRAQTTNGFKSRFDGEQVAT